MEWLGGDNSRSDNEGKKATAPQPGVKYGCWGTNVREAGFCMGPEMDGQGQEVDREKKGKEMRKMREAIRDAGDKN